MKIFVCVKQVPDTETKLKISNDRSGIDTAAVKWIMNPYDEYAVEEALKYRDSQAGSQVYVVSVGPKQRVIETLRTALAMGADEGIVVNSAEFIDPYSTAKALAEVIKGEGGAKVIFTGKLAIDDNAASVSQMLAEFLNIPCATVISKFKTEQENFLVERDSDGGTKELLQLSGPSVIAANKGLNSPRYASLPGIMKAKKKVIKEIELSSLGVGASDNKIKYSELTLPPEKPSVRMLSGESSNQVSQLVTLLRDEAKVL